MENIKNVAIVTDYMLTPRGAERVLEDLLRIYPQADIYTSMCNYEKYEYLNTKKIHTTFLQHWFFRKIIYRSVSVLAPIAFENLDLSKYDLVLSITAGPAKSIITPVTAKHISIICTPSRHQWEGDRNIRGSIFKHIYSLGSFVISSYLRLVEITSVKRIDYAISISKYIQGKVKKYYKLDTPIVYPSVRDMFLNVSKPSEIDTVKKKFGLPNTYILSVGGLYDYKQFDISIRLSVAKNIPLVIVGHGPDLRYLISLVKKITAQVIFINNISDIELKHLYAGALAFVFPSLEDFGIVSLEAMSQGTPVFGLNDGGTKEIILHCKTGYLFESEEQLNELFTLDNILKINRKDCIMRSHEFGFNKFRDNILKHINKAYE